MQNQFGDKRRKRPQEKREHYFGAFTDIDTAVWIKNQATRCGVSQSGFIHDKLKKVKQMEESDSV